RDARDEMGSGGVQSGTADGRRVGGVERVSVEPGSRLGGVAREVAIGTTAFGHRRTLDGTGSGDFRIADRDGEVEIVCCAQETSGEVAMLCDRFKEALIEAAARGQDADQLPLNVREHVTVCENCDGVLAQEQFLQSQIDEVLKARVSVDVPGSLAVGVYERLNEKASGPFALQWAAIAMVTAMALGVGMLRDRVQRAKKPNEGAVQVFSMAGPAPEGPKWDDASPAKNRTNAAREHSKKPSGGLVEADLKPLLPPGQREVMDLVVEKIRYGELEGRVFQLNSQPG